MTLLVQKKDALVFLYLQTVRYICICQKFENRLVDKDKDLIEPFKVVGRSSLKLWYRQILPNIIIRYRKNWNIFVSKFEDILISLCRAHLLKEINKAENGDYDPVLLNLDLFSFWLDTWSMVFNACLKYRIVYIVKLLNVYKDDFKS